MTSSNKTITKSLLGGSFLFSSTQKEKIKAMKNEKDEKRNENANRRRRKAEKT
jgi:hypothetical protein